MSAAHAGLLVNGDFEQPVLTGAYVGYSVGQTMGAGWVVEQGTFLSDIIHNSYLVGGGVSWHPSPSGNQYCYVADSVYGGHIVSQSVTYNAGANSISFIQADFRSNGAGGQVTLDIVDSGNVSIIGGPTLFTTGVGDYWAPRSLSFSVPTNGDYKIRFGSVAGHAGLIDAVQTTAVPEPATILGLVCGLGFVIRRRKK